MTIEFMLDKEENENLRETRDSKKLVDSSGVE